MVYFGEYRRAFTSNGAYHRNDRYIYYFYGANPPVADILVTTPVYLILVVIIF